VVLVYKQTDKKSIGFIMRNESNREPLENFAVCVDSVEKITCIHFFAALPVAVKRQIESHVDLAKWNFINRSNSNVRHSRSMNKNIESVRNMPQKKTRRENTDGKSIVFKNEFEE
jgi:hypothetical protein